MTPQPQTHPEDRRPVLTIAAVALGLAGAVLWAATAVHLAGRDWGAAMVTLILAVGLLAAGYRLIEDPADGDLRGTLLWMLTGTGTLSLLALVALIGGTLQALVAAPAIAVLMACGRRYSHLVWLMRDRRDAGCAHELFTMPVTGRTRLNLERRMSTADVREITTPAWAIDAAM